MPRACHQLLEAALTLVPFLFVLLFSVSLAAEPPPKPDESYDSGVVPGLISIVPGVALHGAGHFASGETRTAWRLLAAQGIGLATMFGGISTLALTGAAPEFNAPGIALLMGGGLLFFGSWFADIYGSFGAEKIAGFAPTSIPDLELRQGVMMVRNPILDPTWFSKTGIEGTLGRWTLRGEGYLHLGADDVRGDLNAAFRFYGLKRSAKPIVADGTHIDLDLGYRFHQYDQRRVGEHTGSIAVDARYDLRRIGPSLRGAFIDAKFGLGYVGYRYRDIGVAEFSDLIVGDIGIGIYLSRDTRGWGEFRLFYDHRHDGYLGGSKLNGLGSGAIGSVNARLSRSLFGNWGFELGTGIGSAWVTDISIVHRWGAN